MTCSHTMAACNPALAAGPDFKEQDRNDIENRR